MDISEIARGSIVRVFDKQTGRRFSTLYKGTREGKILLLPIVRQGKTNIPLNGRMVSLSILDAVSKKTIAVSYPEVHRIEDGLYPVSFRKVFEVVERRLAPRVPVGEVSKFVKQDGSIYKGLISDMSETGISIIVENNVFEINEKVMFYYTSDYDKTRVKGYFIVVRKQDIGDPTTELLGCEFVERYQEVANLVATIEKYEFKH